MSDPVPAAMIAPDLLNKIEQAAIAAARVILTGRTVVLKIDAPDAICTITPSSQGPI
ncbi:MAG: hypothetical protein HY695_36390 [Deltaproteobacteria bacterium]|nr:hypothetical protein [Deltaproteobacteria bacterium]